MREFATLRGKVIEVWTTSDRETQIALIFGFVTILLNYANPYGVRSLWTLKRTTM